MQLQSFEVKAVVSCTKETDAEHYENCVEWRKNQDLSVRGQASRKVSDISDSDQTQSSQPEGAVQVRTNSDKIEAKI